MSVLVELAIFPTDKGISVSTYVVKAVQIIKDSGLAFQLGPMGTCLEGDYDKVMQVVSKCFYEMQKHSDRIYMTVKLDYRKGVSSRLQGKMDSISLKLI